MLKLNHREHGDGLRFSKSIGHYKSGDGGQVGLPVLGEEAGGRGGRVRPPQGTDGKQQLTVTRSPRRSGA